MLWTAVMPPRAVRRSTPLAGLMSDMTADPQVLIIGGGNAGISLAARLHRHGVSRIAIIEPKDTHTYRPLLSYAGAGLASPTDYQRDQSTVMPRGVRWIRGAVRRIDPSQSLVELTDGSVVGYEQVVICAGSTPNWSTVPGSEQAVSSPYASTNYVPELAPKTWQLIQRIKRGNAVFTIPAGPAPCPQAGQKILYLACDYWQRQGVLADIDVTLVTPTAGVFGISAIDRQLEPWVTRYGITVLTHAQPTRIDSVDRVMHIQGRTGTQDLRFDFLHHTPVHAAPAWIAEAGLANATGYADIDPETLRHTSVPTVWACGDAADADCSRSGGALRHQTRVLASNLVSVLAGKAPSDRYDGYSVSPITVARGRALVAEYDRARQLTPAIPGIGLTHPRRSWWLADRHVLPHQYWNSILKGR